MALTSATVEPEVMEAGVVGLEDTEFVVVPMPLFNPSMYSCNGVFPPAETVNPQIVKLSLNPSGGELLRFPLIVPFVPLPNCVSKFVSTVARPEYVKFVSPDRANSPAAI